MAQDTKDPKAQAPGEQADKNVKLVSQTNSDVEKAGGEAANRLGDARKERVNVTDSVLGEDDQHGINVKKAQAASFGEEYDPKSDPEENPTPLVPAPSQNQNNLKHPEDEGRNDPHAARTYLGQPL